MYSQEFFSEKLFRKSFSRSVRFLLVHIRASDNYDGWFSNFLHSGGRNFSSTLFIQCLIGQPDAALVHMLNCFGSRDSINNVLQSGRTACVASVEDICTGLIRRCAMFPFGVFLLTAITSEMGV